MKPKQEIRNEIRCLEEILPKIRENRPVSCFNDDNVGAIEAQIKVLTYLADDAVYFIEDDISEFGEGDYVEDMALYAFYWANDEEEEAPSDEWADLC